MRDVSSIDIATRALTLLVKANVISKEEIENIIDKDNEIIADMLDRIIEEFSSLNVSKK